MTLMEPPGGGGDPNGTIKVSPGTWTTSSHPVQTSGSTSADLQGAVVSTINDLMDALGTFSFVQGATHLASSLSTFSGNIVLGLGCIAVDMAVVSSGLQAAARAFQSLDHSLTTMFGSLEKQMAYYTTTTTIQTTSVATYTPLHMTSTSSSSSHASHSSGNGFTHFFGSVWHHVTSWGSDVYHGVEHGVESIGAPGWLAIGCAVVVAGLFYIVIAAPAVAVA